MHLLSYTIKEEMNHECKKVIFNEE
jgi:hypothetical protein